MAKILITGTAGFIGFHLAEALLLRGDEVIGLDNINDYYSVDLKLARLSESGIAVNDINWNTLITSSKYPKYQFVKMNLEDKQELMGLCANESFDIIIHLAAQAGVRYSIENPDAYAQSNIIGFLNILEAARHYQVKHLVYASSSSVYGLNEEMPFSVKHNVDHPVSLYAASKKSNELMAHAYSHLYKIPTSALRFFTVYGPWGRPDMAYFIFADAIRQGKPIQVFNHGMMKRDFTYVDDIVKGIINVSDNPAIGDKDWNALKPDPSSSIAPYKVFNIGNNQSVQLMDFIQTMADEMGLQPEMLMLEMQPGDVLATWANIDELINNFDYKPNTSIKTGLNKFVKWYKQYNNI